MKKVLIVEESIQLRDYLLKKVTEAGLEAVNGINGLEGAIKMRQDLPDLIIMDHYLTRKSSVEFLIEKNENPNLRDTPVIFLSEKMDQDELVRYAKLGVTKILTKPLKLDLILKTISDLLNVNIALDRTPCIVEAHFNEEILFIEVAQGLNTEKIMLLQFKIEELLSMYRIRSPRILIMITNIDFDETGKSKLELLFRTVMESGQKIPGLIKVLSTAEEVKAVLDEWNEFRGIGMVNSLDKAMDDLIGMKPDAFAHDTVARERLLKNTADNNGSVELRFESEATLRKLSLAKHVAVVDDDMVIRTLIKTVFEEVGWNIIEYENGRQFLDAEGIESLDLIFLDLNMPEVNGFQVLQQLRKLKIDIPVIVLSALSKKDTILKAMQFGVHTFLRKPLKPEGLLLKAAEVLARDIA